MVDILAPRLFCLLGHETGGEQASLEGLSARPSQTGKQAAAKRLLRNQLPSLLLRYSSASHSRRLDQFSPCLHTVSSRMTVLTSSYTAGLQKHHQPPAVWCTARAAVLFANHQMHTCRLNLEMQAASRLERGQTTCLKCRGSGTLRCDSCEGKGTVKPSRSNSQVKLAMNK